MNRLSESVGTNRPPSTAWQHRDCPASPRSPDELVAWSIRLAPTPRAPGVARRAVGPLAAHLGPEAMETVRLLVSELVTNAVLHGGDRTSSIELRAHLLSDSVVISVTDDGTGFDPLELSGSRSDEPGGRGLELVVALADARGIDNHRPFRLWFALSR